MKITLYPFTITVQAGISTYSFFKRDEGVNIYFVMTLIAGGWASAVVVCLNTLGIIFEQSFTGYFIGLFWLVMATAMFFSRLVYLGFVTRK